MGIRRIENGMQPSNLDLGQGDPGLYRRHLSEQHRMCWTSALTLAARRMGYAGYMDVPDALDWDLRALAREIQGGNQ